MECRPQTKGKPAVACRVRCEVPRFRAAFNANLLKEVFLCSKTKSLHKNPTFPSGSLPKKTLFHGAKDCVPCGIRGVERRCRHILAALRHAQNHADLYGMFSCGVLFRADCRRTCRRTRRRDRLFRRRRVCAKPGDSLRVGAYRRYPGAHVVY